jgi:hypothetical protein
MTNFGSISGGGRLLVGREDVGSVDYRLRTSEYGDTKFVAGELTRNAKGIVRASTDGSASLLFEDGHVMPIHVYQATSIRGLFQAEGSVPGF